MTRRIGMWACMAACSACLAAPSVAVSLSKADAANLRAARADVRLLLRRLRLPAGAVEVARDPSAGRVLSHVQLTLGGPNLTVRHRFYRVPGSPDAVDAWIIAHRPRKSLWAGGTDSLWQYGFGDEEFGWPNIAGAVISRQMQIDIAPASAGGTAVHVAAANVWWVTRPVSERVPDGVRAVVVARSAWAGDGWPTPPARSWHVRAALKVRRIVALVDSLPAGQPGFSSCFFGGGPTVTLTFSGGARRARPLAGVFMDNSGCGDVEFTVHGKRERWLTDSIGLATRLHRLLGITLA